MYVIFILGLVDFCTFIQHRIELFTLIPYENPPSDTEIQNNIKKESPLDSK